MGVRGCGFDRNRYPGHRAFAEANDATVVPRSPAPTTTIWIGRIILICLGSAGLCRGPVIEGSLEESLHVGNVAVEVFDVNPGCERIARESMKSMRSALDRA